MGRIKTKLIKRVSFDILEKHRGKFKADFEHNKGKIAEVADIQSRKIRNSVAGYITRLVKREE